MFKGRCQNSGQKDDTNMLENIGNIVCEMYAASHKRPFLISPLNVYIRDWSLITGRGGYKTGGGAREV